MRWTALLLIFALCLPATRAAAQDDCICLTCVFGGQRVFTISATDMFPGLQPGQCTRMAAVSDGGVSIQPGDIIVYQTEDMPQPFIKRVMAVGPAVVSMSDGVLTIDGQMAQRRPMPDFLDTGGLTFGSTDPGQAVAPLPCATPYVADTPCLRTQVQETLPNGATYVLLDAPGARTDDMGMVVVPPGQVFLLGDHRDNSVDSRFPNMPGGGLIPLAAISHVRGPDPTQ